MKLLTMIWKPDVCQREFLSNVRLGWGIPFQIVDARTILNISTPSFTKSPFLFHGGIDNMCAKNLLPPANEVWDKVMFLHLSVRSHGGMMSLSVWLCGPTFHPGVGLPGDGSASRGSASGGWLGRTSPSGDQKSGQYTSYWYAFLLCYYCYF